MLLLLCLPRILICPFCHLHCRCPCSQAERWLEFLLSRKGRDAPMFLRKWLREAARKVGLLCTAS